MNFVVTDTNFDTCNPWKTKEYSAAIKAHFNLIQTLSSVRRLIFVGDYDGQVIFFIFFFFPVIFCFSLQMYF